MFINYPVEEQTISQSFGNDVTGDPVYGKFYKVFDNKHCGVDFPVPVGTKVKVSFSGVVVRAENHLGMGNVVGIRNGNIVALYAHLGSISLHLGDVVGCGDIVGLSGCTGEACSIPHLHFELRDITRSTLKDMVFNPPFNGEVEQFKNSFEYTVNNKNTQKTLKKVSLLYFGTEEKWKLLKQTNNLNIRGDDFLDEGSRVIIPNFI